jgi:hypothetical protein
MNDNPYFSEYLQCMRKECSHFQCSEKEYNLCFQIQFGIESGCRFTYLFILALRTNLKILADQVFEKIEFFSLNLTFFL